MLAHDDEVDQGQHGAACVAVWEALKKGGGFVAQPVHCGIGIVDAAVFDGELNQFRHFGGVEAFATRQCGHAVGTLARCGCEGMQQG